MNATNEPVAEGNIAPDFTLPSVSGETITLSDYRGEKAVVLVFLRDFK